MAENMMGVDSSSWGGRLGTMSPSRPGWMCSGLAPQKGLGLHGLPQGVDGGVGHLGGVDEHLVPVNGVLLGVAHGGEQHAAAFRLAVHLLDGLAGPVAVLPEGVVGLDDLQRPGGAQGHAPVAVDAPALVRKHFLADRRHSGAPRWRTGARTPGRRCTGPGSAPPHIRDKSYSAPCSHLLFPHALRSDGTPPAPRRGAHTGCPAPARWPGWRSPRWRCTRCRPVSPTTMLRSFSRSFRAIMPPVKPTRMEKGPVISMPAKGAAQVGHAGPLRCRPSGRWCSRRERPSRWRPPP